VSAVAHPFALRTPWYVREREQQTPFDPEARRPAIQKYDTADFIDRIVADPRDSLAFDDNDDRWSFPVPIVISKQAQGRLRFATHRLVRTPMRKLYQPNHDRFYALAVELFCDEPGLPRPGAGAVPGLEVGFVVRRERVRFLGPPALVRQLAVGLLSELAKQSGNPQLAPILDTDDLDDVVWGQQATGHQFSQADLALLQQIRPRRVVEGWVVTSAGRGSWRTVAMGDQPALLDGEQEQPMWPLPPRAQDCAAARTRSLWFGVVPTYSADVDEIGLPKLDDRSIYRIRCFARVAPAPGHEQCPPRMWWSEPTHPFRLAPFFDPSGSKNRRVSVKLPDFRTLAARAAEPAGPGGIEIVQPPGSQLSTKKPGAIPDLDKDPQDPGGLATSSCTFAIELVTIVAMFVFNLFLPVVLFVFQLWWMLALRFCWPKGDAEAITKLEGFLAGTNLDKITETANKDHLDQLEALLEMPGGAALLAKNNAFKADHDQAKALVPTLDPLQAVVRVAPVPEPKPDDPLCPRPGAGGAP
jgi:hypothetical protein